MKKKLFKTLEEQIPEEESAVIVISGDWATTALYRNGKFHVGSGTLNLPDCKWAYSKDVAEL